MEYADLHELWEAASSYQGTMDVAITYGVNDKDLEDTKMRLEKAMKATDIAGIPAMLCKHDLHESGIYGATIKYHTNFCDFLTFISEHRLAIWKIDRSIGEIEKFMRGVADSLRDGKKALDEKGKTTPSPMDKDAVKLAEAYINGDFPSLTDEAFVTELLKDCYLIPDKERRVGYLLSLPLDLSGKVRKLMQKAIEEPKPAPALTTTEINAEGNTTTEDGFLFQEKSTIDLEGLKRIWELCTSDRKDIGNYLKTPTAGRKVAFNTSYSNFVKAVNYANFSAIFEDKETTKVKVRYLIYYLSKFLVDEWYTLAAESIKLTKSSCSGANVEESFKDELNQAYKCSKKK